MSETDPGNKPENIYRLRIEREGLILEEKTEHGYVERQRPVRGISFPSYSITHPELNELLRQTFQKLAYEELESVDSLELLLASPWGDSLFIVPAGNNDEEELESAAWELKQHLMGDIREYLVGKTVLDNGWYLEYLLKETLEFFMELANELNIPLNSVTITGAISNIQIDKPTNFIELNNSESENPFSEYSATFLNKQISEGTEPDDQIDEATKTLSEAEKLLAELESMENSHIDDNQRDFDEILKETTGEVNIEENETDSDDESVFNDASDDDESDLNDISDEESENDTTSKYDYLKELASDATATKRLYPEDDKESFDVSQEMSEEEQESVEGELEEESADDDVQFDQVEGLTEQLEEEIEETESVLDDENLSLESSGDDITAMIDGSEESLEQLESEDDLLDEMAEEQLDIDAIDKATEENDEEELIGTEEDEFSSDDDFEFDEKTDLETTEESVIDSDWEKTEEIEHEVDKSGEEEDISESVFDQPIDENLEHDATDVEQSDDIEIPVEKVDHFELELEENETKSSFSGSKKSKKGVKVFLVFLLTIAIALIGYNFVKYLKILPATDQTITESIDAEETVGIVAADLSTGEDDLSVSDGGLSTGGDDLPVGEEDLSVGKDDLSVGVEGLSAGEVNNAIEEIALEEETVEDIETQQEMPEKGSEVKSLLSNLETTSELIAGIYTAGETRNVVIESMVLEREYALFHVTGSKSNIEGWKADFATASSKRTYEFNKSNLASGGITAKVNLLNDNQLEMSIPRLKIQTELQGGERVNTQLMKIDRIGWYKLLNIMKITDRRPERLTVRREGDNEFILTVVP